jgi:hypothetical protein
MVLTAGQVPEEYNLLIPIRFALGINSTLKFFFTTFEKFQSH